MKKLLFILVLIGSVSGSYSQTNVYHPFPTHDAFWGDKGYNIFNAYLCYNTRYGINGDTVIGSNNYKAIYSLFDSTLTNPYSSYFAAIREQDKRVYVVINPFPEELLYDFNLLVGDTITHHLSLMHHTIDTFAQVVTQIDSILLLDGTYRKRWTLAPVFDPPHPSMSDIVVEGIGSVHWRGLFNPLYNDALTNGDQYSFECFKQNDTALYVNNPICNHCFCSFLTDIESPIKLEKIIISPNPFTTITKVNFDKTYPNITLSLYDLQGKLLLQNHYTDCNLITLHRNQLPNGLYFLKLIIDDKEIETRKIVIGD